MRAPLAALLSASLAACAGAPPPCPPSPTAQATTATTAKAETPRTPFEATRALELKLAPQRDQASNAVTLEVSMRFPIPPAEFGDASPLVLRVRDAGSDAEGRIEELFARDGEGALAFVRTPADPAQKGQLAFKAERRARGPLSLSYRGRIPTSNTLDLGAHGGSFTGLGRTFLLLPATSDPYVVGVQWDLAEAGPGAVGISSLGEGNFDREAPLSELEGAVWASGPLHRTVVNDARRGARFGMTMAGWGAHEALAVSAWTGRVWFAGRTFGREEGGAPSLELFLHAGPGKTVPASEAGDGHVLVRAGDDLEFTWPLELALARAVSRGVLGFTVNDKAGPARWFEGFVTFWAYHFMMRGTAKPEEVLADLTARTERYFASPSRNKPLSELAGGGEAEAQHIEDRGLLFAGELHSSFTDSTVNEQAFARFLYELGQGAGREGGGPGIVEESAFAAALAKRFGPKGKERFEAVILGQGAVPELAGHAYGLCFDKVKKKIRVGTGKESVEGFSWIRRPKGPAECGPAGR